MYTEIGEYSKFLYVMRSMWIFSVLNTSVYFVTYKIKHILLETKMLLESKSPCPSVCP